MQTGWLEGTDAAAVSDVVTRVLEAEGALVDEHTATHVRFEGWDLDRRPRGGTETAEAPNVPAPGGHAFERGGAITLAQHAGEEDVEVRVRVRARLTSRVFWTVVFGGLVLVLLTILVDPAPSAWFSLGIALWGLLLVAALLHVGTIPASREAERRLLARILDEARAVAGAALTDEERLKAEAAAAAEAEALERRLKGR